MDRQTESDEYEPTLQVAKVGSEIIKKCLRGAPVIKIQEDFSNYRLSEIFIKIKENFISPQNTGGNVQSTGVTGDRAMPEITTE